MEGLAKSESSEDFGADRVLGHVGLATDFGDEENSRGWLFSDASHWVLFYGERSELGEISTLAFHPKSFLILRERCKSIELIPIDEFLRKLWAGQIF
jgi:hypothetical protein